jgi:hypothetical protein
VPENKKVLQTRWVFNLKRNAKGIITRYKARWVAKGYNQKHGIDYEETYAAVMKMKSARVLICLALEHNLKVYQADISTAYLNGQIDKEIYVVPPEGYRKTQDRRMGRLIKALYGTKQGGRQWWLEITTFLITKLGFTATKADPCVFYKKDHQEQPTYIGVYVDDFEIVSTPSAKEEIIQTLQQKYEVKDLILGIKVKPNYKNQTAHLSQPALTEQIIHKACLTNATARPAPIQPGIKMSITDASDMSPEEQERMRKVPYRSIIGMLLYLAMGTRPDIAFAVSYFSRFSAQPSLLHWRGLKQVVRYLIGTKSYGIRYSKSGQTTFESFSDADWASDSSDRKSITGWIIRMRNGALCWSSTKQKCVALSTMEAELIALAAASSEVLWWRQLLAELGVKQAKPTVIHEDNQSCIAYAKNSGSAHRAKHIDLRYHFVRDEITNGKLKLRYIQSRANPADIFTKPLPPAIFLELRTLLGIIDGSAS